MKLLHLSLLTFICWANGEQVSESKFLLTAPRMMTSHSKEKLSLTIFDNPSKSDFQLRLVQLNGTEMHSMTITGDQATEKMHTIDFHVPSTKLYSAQLEVVYDGNKTVKSEVRLQNSQPMLFIETDRPFYKPGELVRFRILHLERKLMPVSQPIKRVWIESSTGIKMAQWKKVEAKNGLAQLELQLSTEPVQGEWKIKVQATSSSDAMHKTFEVKEYVLPKFEVIVSPPTYIAAKANSSYTWRVCAKYSFGKPVQGNATAFFEFEKPHYHWRHSWRSDKTPRPDSVHFHELRKEDGCHEFELERSVFETMEQQYASGIKVHALVEERGTGEKQTSEVSQSQIHQESIKIDFSESQKYVYPGLPYFGKVLLKYQNGMPLANTRVKIEVKKRNLVTHNSQIVTTDDNGYGLFTIAPLGFELGVKILVEMVERVGYMMVQETFEPPTWYSNEVERFILINGASEVACDQNKSLDILFNFNGSTPVSKITFFYLVHSRGELAKKGRKVVELKEHVFSADFQQKALFNGITTGYSQIGKWSLDLNIEPNLAPEAQIVIYYEHEGKVIASSSKLKIKNCLKHTVQSKFVEKNAQPGETVTLTLSASSKSLCALSGVDKAVTFLDRERALNLERVFTKLKEISVKPEYDEDSVFSVRDCENDDGHESGSVTAPRREKRSFMFGLSTLKFGNAKRAFSDGGVIVLSNLKHAVKPCTKGDHKEECDYCEPKGYGGVFLMMRSDAMEGMAKSMSRAVPEKFLSATNAENDVGQTNAVEMRTDFPETWLWQLEEIGGKDETKTLKLETPHSITDWVLNTVCLSSSEGVGIAPETSLRVTKPYFMDFTLPYSVKRGEVLPLKVTLFNYLNEAIPIKLKFGDFTGGDLTSEATFSACLAGKDSLVHTFKLDAKVLGQHNVSVRASLAQELNSTCGPAVLVNMRDGVTKSVKIKPEGFPVEITNSMFLCLNPEDGETTSMTWHLPVPANAVPDSARGEVSVIGDVMGPSLENLDGLVQLPMGCGEQNMILFVPNIVVLNYLNSTDATSNPSLRTKALANMVKGYQRELNYRHDDGSYSAFGKSDPSGSMWLTAFVVKSLAQAKKFIFIDDHDLEISVRWIEKRQLENGCFPQVGQVFHKEMKGGVGDSNSAATSLTAYVLISLLESNRPLKKNLLQSSLLCLTKGSEETDDLYSTLLTTYALQLLAQRVNTSMVRAAAQKYLDQVILKASTNKEGSFFWQKTGVPNLAMDVEMTSYAVLALVKAGGEENLMHALNAVKWISKQRNGQGGFVSTQDTVVALEALAKFATAIPADQVKMKLSATTDDSQDISDFAIDEENRQILQQKEISHVPTYVHWIATGQGCSLIQSILRYNLPKTVSKENAFSLERNVSNIVPGLCNELYLTFNVTYNLEDEASNMAVLEVELLSGYEPVKSSLDDLKFKPHLDVKRWDFEDGKVNIYFDSIKKNQLLHFGFVIEQKVIVENVKPAQMKLYDYYEQESFVRQEYGLEGLICSWEMLPAPEVVIVEAGNPSATKLFALPTIATESPEEQLADAPDPNGENVIDDRFRDFTNVDFDLETPKGNEGPEPVYVPAPRNPHHR